MFTLDVDGAAVAGISDTAVLTHKKFFDGDGEFDFLTNTTKFTFSGLGDIDDGAVSNSEAALVDFTLDNIFAVVEFSAVFEGVVEGFHEC